MSREQPFVGYIPESNLPVRQGDRLTIPAGVSVHRPTSPPSMPSRVVLKRAQRVTVHHILPGSNVMDRYGTPASDPKIVWAGSGGYWCEVSFNELASAGALPREE